MNLPALYSYLRACSKPVGNELRIAGFTWHEVARYAEVHELEDTAAFRALIGKGVIERIHVPNTWGDCDYRLRTPKAGCEDAFAAVLRVIGMRMPAELMF